MASSMTATPQLWPGIHDLRAELRSHRETYDVTAFGDYPAPALVPGPLFEEAEITLRCDRPTFRLLMAVLGTQPEILGAADRLRFDVAASDVLSELPTSPAKGPNPLGPLEERPIRLITLED